MLISEAVKKAMESGRYITRQSIVIASGHGKVVAIKPSNSHDACALICFNFESKRMDYCRHWNPKAEDLMACDWEVVSV